MKIVFSPLTGKFDLVKSAAEVMADVQSLDGTGSGLDADLLDGQHASAFANLLVDTRANILATAPTGDTIAISTDEPAFYVYSGSTWKRSPIPFGTPNTAISIGALPYNDDHGYGILDLSDKDLHNVVLKDYDTNSRAAMEGALRKTALTSTTNAVQAYINGAWRTLLAYTAAQEDAIMLWTDAWQTYDMWGKNIIHGSKVDMGAFSSDHLIDGGVISDQTP
jgi:hypothetical protein